MNDFIMGAIAMGFGVASLVFFRYWKESGDRLFAWFALAFFVLAVNRVALVFFNEASENAVGFYLIRLCAFGMIIVAIVDKNFRRT